jgi:hypothetical protein
MLRVQKVRSLTLSTPEDLARMTKCETPNLLPQSYFARTIIRRLSLCTCLALASALNKTGAFAKTSITPANSSAGGSASDLLAMTSRLKGAARFV